ncbi:MAG: rhamnogalacturonan acetylesterase [Candidatus Hydrogenedentes bacterium]|nr:rhamnogalacturonan acetylesterase [Candidatus Hydrogenedentota bacterium]
MLLFAAFSVPVSAADDANRLPTLYVIGDSTAAAYSMSRYPLFGWAQVLQHYFDASKLRVADRAISGRSSKSFYDAGSWTPIRELLQPGDYVFIQFGHNDQKKDDPKRYTEPTTTYTEYLKRYVDETRSAGATPILLTPINRNSWETPKKLRDSLGGYPDAVRKLAKSERVPLIDLHKRTARLYRKLGQERTTRLFIYLPPGLYPAYPDGRPDNTHLQERGAYTISGLAIKAIRRQRIPLRRYLKSIHHSWGLKRRLQQKADF